MSSAKKCPLIDQLELLAVGRLPDPPASSLEEHLLECESCAQQTALLQTGDTLVAALKQAGSVRQQQSPDERVRLELLIDSLSGLRAEQVDATQVSDIPRSQKDDSTAREDVVGELRTTWQPAQAADELGRLGVYRIIKPLGAGGMGAVFLAEDSQLHRLVALKMMRPRIAANADAAERFLREARAAAAVRHAHILTIYHVGKEEGVPFLAMEYLEGQSLEQRLKRESPLPISDVLRIGREIAEGLDAAHSKGLIHRDIKPANIWLERIDSPVARPQSRPLVPREHSCGEQQSVGSLGRTGASDLPSKRAVPSFDRLGTDGAREFDPATVSRGKLDASPRIGLPLVERVDYFDGDRKARVKLLDFGLARSVEADSQLTSSGMILGTPSYMAPEQASCEVVDGRADLFSLGVVLYRMTTGRLPFPGTKTMEVLRALASITPASPRSVNPAAPKELSDLIDRLLEKHAKDRPESAAEVVSRLADIEHVSSSIVPPRRTDRQFGIALAGIAFVALLSVVIITMRTEDGKETKVAITVPGDVDSVSTTVLKGEGSKSDVTQKDLQSGNVRKPETRDHHSVEGGNAIAAKDAKHITLDALDPTQIPKSERFDWQPEELVAVIGQHQLRDLNQITSVVFHPSSSFFISYSGSGTQVWSMKTLERITGSGDMEFPVGVRPGSSCFTQDGKTLFIGSSKYRVDMTDPEQPKFQLLSKPAIANPDAEFSVVSPDGRWGISAVWSRRNGLAVWNITGDVPLLVNHVDFPKEYGLPLTQLMGSEGGRRLALNVNNLEGLGPPMILLWDVDWDAPDWPKLTPTGEAIPGLLAALSTDGNKLVKSNVDGTRKQLLDLSATPPKVEFEFEPEGPGNQFSPDGNWIAGTNFEGIILQQKTATAWERRSVIPTVSTTNSRFWFSRDGKSIIVSDNEIGALRVWDLTVSPPAERIPTRTYRAVRFSPNGTLLATKGGEANAVWSVDGVVPKLISELGPGSNWHPDMCLSFSPDSKLLAILRSVEIYDSIVWNLGLPIPQVISDSDTRFVSFSVHDQNVDSWNGTRWFSQSWEVTKRGRFRLGTDKTEMPNGFGHYKSLRSLRPSVGRWVKLHDSCNLQVWSSKDDTKPLFEVEHPDKTPVDEFTLSDDGKFLAAFTPNGRNFVWNLTETPPRVYPLSTAAAYNNCAFFTQDGKLLIVANNAGIQIHDWAVGGVVRQFRLGPVPSLAVHPDGRHVATVNGNGTIYILRLPELAQHLKK